MTDILLESIRVVIIFAVVLYLWKMGRNRFKLSRQGWNFIVAGFTLLLFGSLLDVTDNYETLSRFVVIGDTRTQAVLEKLVGSLGGFLLIAIGLVRWLPTIQQISEESRSRQRAEQALHTSESQVRVLLNSTAEAIYSLDLEGNCTFVNPACIRLLGYDYSSEFLGQNMHDLIHHTTVGGQPRSPAAAASFNAFDRCFGEESNGRRKSSASRTAGRRTRQHDGAAKRFARCQQIRRRSSLRGRGPAGGRRFRENEGSIHRRSTGRRSRLTHRLQQRRCP